MLDPVEQAVARHPKPLRQLASPPFIPTECLAGLAMPVGLAQSQLASQRLHTHTTPALLASQRWEAVSFELASNRLERLARCSQFLHAGTDRNIVCALPIAGNRPHQHTFGLAASGPGDLDPHLLAGALRFDLHSLDHLAENLFAVRIRGRGCAPVSLLSLSCSITNTRFIYGLTLLRIPVLHLSSNLA